MPQSSGAAVTSAPLCWVNGLRVDPGAPALSVRDRGFTLADGCFETMRAYAGTIFRLDAHLARLAATADALGIPVPPHLDATIIDGARALRGSGADHRVRLTVTRGCGSGVAAGPGEPPTTVLLIESLKLAPPVASPDGLHVTIGAGRRNEFSPTAGLKTLAYTDAVVALAAVRARGFDDVVLLDTEGHLSEASASNLFVVIRGVVHTPPRRCGALPGITRSVVLEILAACDIPVSDAPVPGDALSAADEAFLTNSLREIAPVTAVDRRAVGTGTVGPLTRRVSAAFRDVVAREIADSLAVGA